MMMIEFLAEHKDSIIEANVEVTELMGAETYIYLSKGNSKYYSKS